MRKFIGLAVVLTLLAGCSTAPHTLTEAEKWDIIEAVWLDLVKRSREASE